MAARLLTADEVRDTRGIPRSTLYWLAKTGQVPCVHWGRRAVRFPEDELDRWLAQQLRRPEPQPAA